MRRILYCDRESLQLPRHYLSPWPALQARPKILPPPKREATTEGQDSIRPKGKWPGGDNGPVDEIMGAA
jgi:hypothetical protein